MGGVSQTPTDGWGGRGVKGGEGVGEEGWRGGGGAEGGNSPGGPENGDSTKYIRVPGPDFPLSLYCIHTASTWQDVPVLD